MNKYDIIRKDYLMLLKYALETYEITNDIKITNQLKKIISVIENYDGNINKDMLDTIQLYIDNLKTCDESIIIAEGKILYDMLR